LQENVDVYKKMHDEPIWIEMLTIVREGLNHLYMHNNTKDLDEIFADEHFAQSIRHPGNTESVCKGEFTFGFDCRTFGLLYFGNKCVHIMDQKIIV